LVSSKQLFLAIVVIFVAALAVAAVALPELNRTTTSTSTTTLPPGCVKPADGFLIIASQLGYNDSVEHGVPQNSWPVIDVKLGENVSIVVCNADPAQSHGFQIDHYYDARLVAVASGQVLTVSFTADVAGTFRVYCNIPCTIHWAMQSGELIVS
jgi:heme/copper-type cytochrome/quinol oxidase subunit 2